MREMFSHLKNITQRLRCCSCCGSCFGNTDFLCEACWQRLEARVLPYRNQTIKGYPFEIKSVFRWDGKENEIVREITYNLKGGVETEFYARILSQWHIPGYSDQSIIVPAPPANPLNPKDHAMAWARSVSGLTGLLIASVLSRTSGTSQKVKGAKDRHELSFSAVNDVKMDNIIFVDDVVTTGATAQAAFRALGCPKNFAVWCIVCNPPRGYC